MSDKVLAEKLQANFGLDLLMIQNDISEEAVIRLLLIEGLIDPDDYTFEDVDQYELDLED